MSHSVVTVTDGSLNDKLYLIVGEDGTVTPDRETVETYLSSRDGPTEIQLMHVNKTDSESIELSVENLTYIHSNDNEEEIPKQDMDEVARNLLNFKLDHDYTPFTSPKRKSSVAEDFIEDDELAQTLSILEGSSQQLQSTSTPAKTIKIGKPTTIKTIKRINMIPGTTIINSKTKAKIVTTAPPLKQTKTILIKPQVNKLKTKITEEDDDDPEDEDYLDDEQMEDDDDEDDSDYEMEMSKIKQTKKITRTRSNKPNIVEIPKNTVKIKTVKQVTPTTPKVPEPESPKLPEKLLEQPVEVKAPEKKPIKKEKKIPKPLPDDFALFSTPDIIRRVGGKQESISSNQPTTPTTPETVTSPKPAKITPENRTKSATERITTNTKLSRTNSEGKLSPEKIEKPTNYVRSNTESKLKDRRLSTDVIKRSSTDEKIIRTDKITNEILIPPKTETQVTIQNLNDTTNSSNSSETANNSDEPIPSAEDIRAIILNENTKSFTSNLVIPEQIEQQQNLDHNNMNLETGGLELDQSILDNIGSDLISEDILMQVAQSLVDNTDLQNVIDKSIVEGNLVLDPAIQQAITSTDNNLTQEQSIMSTNQNTESNANGSPKGTQIVRPDGRIVVIPPIERPTTRSRNKKKQEVEEPKVIVKPTHKPLDEEHVSGNELDSSSSEEDKSEDDPDKLWCICNQPHNNRFMICCDTCEEWYHGKCVNVTKAMGQLMEQEGREWICLYCKDPSLKRPQAAARRIRKASRASTDSAGSHSKSGSTSSIVETTKPSVVACIVCGQSSRKNSVYCSETCILKHAQGVEKVVVFERSTGTILSDSRAPSAANLEKWLQEHPGYEVVRSTNKFNTNKQQQNVQSKLKLIKTTNTDNITQKKNIPQITPKSNKQQLNKPPMRAQITGLKIVSKQVSLNQPKAKLIQPAPVSRSPSLPSTSIKTKPPQTPTKITSTPKEKSIPQKTPKARQAEQGFVPQPKQQENIRDNVKKTLFEQLTNRLKMVDDLKLTEDDVNNISNEIESQLYKCFGDTGQKYRNKYRSLIFNIKDVKNQTLWRRICEKSVNPYQLVRLSPDDLASQELALWRERETKHQLDMIKKSELELLNCNRQYVFKTHKGEQVLEDGRPSDAVDSTEVIASLRADSTSLENSSDSKTEPSKEREKKSSSSKHSKRDKDRERKSSKDKSDGKEHTKKEHRSSSRERDRRKRSRSRDRTSRHNDKKRSRSRDRDRERSRRSSHKSSSHKKDNHNSTDKLDKRSKEILEQLVDKQIVPPLEDRLWKHVSQEDIQPVTAESDSDHEPTSTVTIPTPPRNNEPEETQPATFTAEIEKKEVEKPTTEASPVTKEVEDVSKSPPLRTAADFIWKGTINMIDVAQISITAHEVSGDCNGLGEELPSTLDIVGRICPDTVWDYIGKMRCSNSKMISLIRLNATNIEEKMPYIALYSYLSSRNRLGVVKSNNKAVKDFYILPLASQKPIPQALLPINGPGFEESRPALLLGIIVRDKKKRSLIDSLPTPSVKRVKVEIVPSSPVTPTPARSYTPPPNRDPRLKLPYTPAPVPLPTPPITTEPDAEPEADDMDEPYSPEDSDPDSIPVIETSTEASNSHLNANDLSNLLTGKVKASSFLDSGLTTQTFEPFTSKFDTIPGLDDPTTLPSSSQELQRKMAELDQRIAMQKAEIDNMSQDIVSTATGSADIGTTALANIALPSNLQQILDSIKTIGTVASSDSQDSHMSSSDAPTTPASQASSDLTIPLILPKIGSRQPPGKPEYTPSYTTNTIPLNLPNKIKPKQHSSNEPEKSSGSVLSSLSEEDLIRKAAEMLGETTDTTTTATTTTASKKVKDSSQSSVFTPPATFMYTTPPPSIVPPSPIISGNTLSPNKRTKLDLNQPPVPGLEDET